MGALRLHENWLGFELRDGGRLAALYRAREELPRTESPKPCFAPIYTPSGILVTEYRPADHPWHTGLYFGWVHAGPANLWGGPWYLPEKDKYDYVEHSHGVQRHDGFLELREGADRVEVREGLTWLDADDRPLAAEHRAYTFQRIEGSAGYAWTIATQVEPLVDGLVMGASRAARYSGLELRMGPPFADACHRSSEGAEGHESIMGQRARWVSARGAAGGAVVMMDHSGNPRHPVTWFARRNLLGAGLLMSGDLELQRGENLALRYGFLVLDEELAAGEIEQLYRRFVG